MTPFPSDPPVPERDAPRVEDARLLRGTGSFTDDNHVPGALHAVFVRSSHAHALLGEVGLSVAAAMPGVVAAFHGRHLARAGVNPIPTAWLLDGMQPGERRALAIDRVRYEGEAIAVIIADTAAAASDAADQVTVDYEPLPSVADVAAAAAPGAPTVYDNAPRNVCFEWELGDREATTAAFNDAHRVIRQEIRNNRLIPNAIEPRACIATWNAGRLTLHVTSRNPHLHRLILSEFVLGIPEHQLRVISGDVGGGFGSRVSIYAEEVAIAWAARFLRRPVRWTATRQECFATDGHGRDHATDAAMAFDASGRITGLRVRTRANMGANLSLHAAAYPTFHYGSVLSGPYAIPAIHCEVTGVFSHTAPVDAYRGAGRPEATYVLERLLDLAARALDEDPVALRGRNLIPSSAFPYRTAVDSIYDTGNYERTLKRAMELSGYVEMRDEQQRLRGKGRHTGIGVSCYVERSGEGPSAASGEAGSRTGSWESALVRVHPTGRVTVHTGSSQQGQGSGTVHAQIAAAALGVPPDDVGVEQGDTSSAPFGMGTQGGGGGPVDGTAVWLAACKVAAKARRVAAHSLGVGESDVEYGGGRFRVRGGDETEWRTFQDVARAAYVAADLPEGMEPGLEATMFFDPPNWTWPSGTHVAAVELDVDTGQVEVTRYVAVDDCGNVVNGGIVDGQVRGGIAQGIGQALWEEAIHGADGRLVTQSLMSYALPRAASMPPFENVRERTPSTSNPLGLKGVGDVGAVAAPAAIVNAVMDALAPFGISHLDMPLTAEKVWLAIHGAGGG